LKHRKFVILMVDSPPLLLVLVGWTYVLYMFKDLSLLNVTLQDVGLDLTTYLMRWLMWLLLWCLCWYFANLCIGRKVSWVGQRSLQLCLGHIGLEEDGLRDEIARK
jgi:hypothetical protein